MNTNHLSNTHSTSPVTNSLKNVQGGLQIPQTTGQNRYPTTILSTRPPILTQQITAHFQLSQEAWNHLSNLIDKTVNTNRLIMKAVKDTYKKLKNVQTHTANKTPTNIKSVEKTHKSVEFADIKGRETKENSKLTKTKHDANNNKKNVMTKSDSVNAIQVSDTGSNMMMG